MLWVQRERDREHGGVRGIFNWLTGRTRMSAKELVRRMLEEADDMMGVLPEGGEVMGMRLPVSLRGGPLLLRFCAYRVSSGWP